jgi:fumarate hydratase class II
MALAPALVPALGYDTVQEICSYAAENKITFLQALIKSKVISEMELYNLIYKELKIDISEKGSSF